MVVLVSISLALLFALVGLSVDLGYSYYVKVKAQGASDAAATAATIYASKNGYVCGSYVTCNSTYTCPSTLTSATTAMQAGCLYAKSNGFLTSGSQSVTLIANNTSPPNESGLSPALWIQANSAQTIPHLFLFLTGFQSGPVAAQATSTVNVTPASSCVYVLDTGNTNGALTISGSSALSVSNCGVYVNSSNPKALTISGSASITATKVSVVGNCTGCAQSSPVPTTGAAAVSNPFASLPAPSFSSTNCGKTNYTVSGTSDTIDPTDGPFCGGINVSGGKTLTMNPGTYILNGGGFTNSGTVTGTHVTIYMTGGGSQTAAPLNLSGGSTTTLSAPSGGAYQGVLFFQDPNAGYAQANSISGSAVLNVSGSFYFPTTSLNLSSSVALSTIGLVVWDLNLSGSASISQDTTGTLTGLASRSARLIQ